MISSIKYASNVANFDDVSLVNIRYIDGREVAVAASTDICRAFGKAHDDVPRDIREMEAGIEFYSENFIPASYINSLGQCQPMYYVKRDGFAVLTAKYNDNRSAGYRFKELFFNQYQRTEKYLMEAIAKNPVRYSPAFGPSASVDMDRLVEVCDKLSDAIMCLASPLTSLTDMRNIMREDFGMAQQEDVDGIRNTEQSVIPIDGYRPVIKEEDKVEYGIRDLAEFVGVNQGMVSKWLRVNGYVCTGRNGRACPSVDPDKQGVFASTAIGRIKFNEKGLLRLASEMSVDVGRKIQ